MSTLTTWRLVVNVSSSKEFRRNLKLDKTATMESEIMSIAYCGGNWKCYSCEFM